MPSQDAYRWTKEDIQEELKRCELLWFDYRAARHRAYSVEKEYWEASLAERFPSVMEYGQVILHRARKVKIRFTDGEQECLIKWIGIGSPAELYHERPKLLVWSKLAGKSKWRKYAETYSADLLLHVTFVGPLEDES